ncbi:MAG: hypothetical protein LRZ88_11450 [Candidatus Cloacimonetes bacterium]|nr:hypothetical protein [Candidatus Cloacimonadota bacterium]
MQWNYWAGNSINLQVKMHEDGKIQFCYGSIDGEINNPSASIGISMSPGGNNWYISVTPGTPATSSSTTSNNSITGYPGNGVVYEFLPTVAAANDLAATSVTGNLTPSINAATIYNVGVRNRGHKPTKHLFSSTDQCRRHRARQCGRSYIGTRSKPQLPYQLDSHG